MTAKRTTLVLKEKKVGQAVVVTLGGSAGMAEAESLRQRLEHLAQNKSPLIVLDLSEMDFISSLGLGAIVAGHLKCRHHQGLIRLVNPQPAVRELLETTRLNQLFQVYSSIDEALAA